MVASLYDPAKHDGTNASLTGVVSPDGKPDIGVRYRIPPRCGVAVKLQASQQLQVENTHGTRVCDFWAYLTDGMGQFLSILHCRTWLQSVFPKIGDRLVTNRRQADLENISNISPNFHDAVMSCCDWIRYQLLGCTEYHDNWPDNPRVALSAIRLEAPHVPNPFNLWMNIPISPDNQTSFQPTLSSRGDVIGLKAIEDLFVVMSACPRDKNPINGGGAVSFLIHFVSEA